MRIQRLIYLLAFFLLSTSVAIGQPDEPLDDFQLGIRFVEEGDFETAAEILEAVTVMLEGESNRDTDVARAYLYLGYALVYTDREEAAKQRFTDAQSYDPQLVPSPIQFPRRVIRLWNAPKPRDRRPTPPPTTPDTILVNTPPSERGGPPVAPSDWLSNNGDRLTMELALATSQAYCAGEMIVDRGQEELTWITSETDDSCLAAMNIPFARIDTVGATEEGGFILRMNEGTDRRLVFIPQPFSAWFRSGSLGLRHMDLPPEDAVATRLAVRELLTALGRPPSDEWSYYGTPVDVSTSELLNTPAGYDGRAVTTRGRFSQDNRHYTLEASGLVIGISPTPEVQALIDANVSRLNDTDITVTGVFRRQPESENNGDDAQPPYSILFWNASSEVLSNSSGSSQGAKNLREVMRAEPIATDEPIDVIGQYRGGNLFGDVPPDTRLREGPDDFVLRDGQFSIWVVGSKPGGNGWSLELLNKRDTSTWLRVRGRIEEINGNYYLRASELEPAQRPWSQTPADPGALGWAPVAPDVQFSLPLPFETASPDTQFVIQFTKPMNQSTFQGNVTLRYAGIAVANDPGFSSASFQYSEQQRSLHIDPGIVLQSGRTLEILLRPNIADITGLSLDSTRTLTWQVGG